MRRSWGNVGYRLISLAICSFASVVLASADSEVDAAVARLSSPNKAERHAAAAEILAWSTRQRIIFQQSRGLNRAETRRHLKESERYEPFTDCDTRLAEAADAAVDLATTRAVLERSYGSVDSDTPREPYKGEELVGGCGSGHSIDEAVRAYVVPRRPDVVREMLADPEVRFRSRLLVDLVKLDDRQDRSIAIAFSKSSNAALRAAGISALANYPDAESRTIVLRAAVDPKGQVRQAAATSLSAWADHESTAALAALVADPYFSVANEAVNSLRDRKSTVAGAACLRLLIDRPARMWMAMSGLRSNPIPLALPVLREHLEEADFGKREILSTIAAIDSAEARALVMKWATSTDRDTKQAALIALETVPGAAAEAQLIDALSDDDPNAQLTACLVLGNRKSQAAIPYLRAIWIKSGKRESLAEDALRSCLGLSEDEEIPEGSL